MLSEIDYGAFKVLVSADVGPLGGAVEGSKEITIRKR